MKASNKDTTDMVLFYDQGYKTGYSKGYEQGFEEATAHIKHLLQVFIKINELKEKKA